MFWVFVFVFVSRDVFCVVRVASVAGATLSQETRCSPGYGGDRCEGCGRDRKCDGHSGAGASAPRTTRDWLVLSVGMLVCAVSNWTPNIEEDGV